MMRKPLWIIAILFAAIAAPNAHADVTEYTINFTVGSTSGTVTNSTLIGSFYYDATSPTPFSDFLVSWNGTTFNLTSEANSPDIVGVGTCFTGTMSAPAETFALLSGGCADAPAVWAGATQTTQFQFSAVYDYPNNYISLADAEGGEQQCGGSPCPTLNQNGNWTITEVTPEPGTAVLWFTGIGLMILTRKRIAHLLRLGTGSQRSLSLH